MLITSEQNTADLSRSTPSASDTSVEAGPQLNPLEASPEEQRISSTISSGSVAARSRRTPWSPHSIAKVISAIATLIDALSHLRRTSQHAGEAASPKPLSPADRGEEPSPSGVIGQTTSSESLPMSNPSEPLADPSQAALPAELNGSGAKVAIPRGAPLQQGHGFLWKPESDKDGKLAILLPERLTGRVAEVDILAPDGSRTLQRGRFSGVGNGGREHFRFSKAGGKFPDGSIVLIKLLDGSRQHLVIRDTAARVQR